MGNHQTKATMKVFATLATILGVAYATPEADAQMGSMGSGPQQHNNVVRMSAVNVMPNMKLRLSTPYQALTGPTQYHLQDEFGNFEYADANQESQKMEKGNDMAVRGQYAYIMSDGVLRRVDYLADNYGFHVLQDNADSSRSQDRIKRSVEPDLIQTRMTSFMDSSSLRDDSMVNPNMYNMMDRPSNIMGQEMVGSNMMDKNMMGHNMMNENMMGRNMVNENMMGHNMMGRNMMGQDMHSMMNKNVMGKNIYSNMMGRDM